LLTPQHAGEGLALNFAHVVGDVEGRHALVEGVGLALALIDEHVDGGAGWEPPCAVVAETEADDHRAAGGDFLDVVDGRLRPRLLRVDGVWPAIDEEVVDAILDVG
jgi:hypothetical protein